LILNGNCTKNNTYFVDGLQTITVIFSVISSMRIVRNILFLNVVIVILLHAVIPHKHHGEMTFDEHQLTHQNANTVFKIIGLVFQEGASTSLDNYVLAEQIVPNKTDITLTSPFAYSTLETMEWPIQIGTKAETVYNVNPPKPLNLQPHGLRGPPCHDFYA